MEPVAEDKLTTKELFIFINKTLQSALYAPAEQIVLWKSAAFAFALGLLPLNPHQEV